MQKKKEIAKTQNGYGGNWILKRKKDQEK